MDSVTFDFYTLIFGVIALVSQTVVITMWITKLKFRVDYIEKALATELAASNKIHEDLRIEIKDLKEFFIKWLQRLEDVTRDRRV